MDITELMRVVRSEGLDRPVIYGDGDVAMDTIILDRDETGWTAFISDERRGAMGRTLQTFDNESDALDYVLTKLRAVKETDRKWAAIREQ